MHDTPTDYLFRATTYKRQGQTQSGEQRAGREGAATARPITLVRPVVRNGDANNHTA